MKADIYLNTSILNFLFADDAPELRNITIELFNVFIKTGIYNSYVSELLIEEINQTPSEAKRRQLLNVLIEYPIELINLNNLSEIERLTTLYISEKAIPESKKFDALHVAVSVIHKLDFLVS